MNFIEFVWIFQILYITWAILYAFLDLQNPYNEQQNDYDSGLYEGLLNFKEYPLVSLGVSFGVLFIVTPILFSIVWMLSYGCYAARNRNSSKRDASQQSTSSRTSTAE